MMMLKKKKIIGILWFVVLEKNLKKAGHTPKKFNRYPNLNPFWKIMGKIRYR